MRVIIEHNAEICELELHTQEPGAAESSLPDPHWRALIQGALYRHRSDPTARYLQLATVDADQCPRNRTIAFRGFVEQTDLLQFAVDSRSEKIPQILANAQTQACWYFRKTREQFRITGTLTPIMAPGLMLNPDHHWQQLRTQLWEQISERSRALWFWPEPKAPRVQATEYIPKIAKETEAPETFVLLLLHPTEVDHLQLKGDVDYPQVRHLHVLKSRDHWVQYPVNP